MPWHHIFRGNHRRGAGICLQRLVPKSVWRVCQQNYHGLSGRPRLAEYYRFLSSFCEYPRLFVAVGANRQPKVIEFVIALFLPNALVGYVSGRQPFLVCLSRRTEVYFQKLRENMWTGFQTKTCVQSLTLKINCTSYTKGCPAWLDVLNVISVILIYNIIQTFRGPALSQVSHGPQISDLWSPESYRYSWYSNELNGSVSMLPLVRLCKLFSCIALATCPMLFILLDIARQICNNGRNYVLKFAYYPNYGPRENSTKSPVKIWIFNSIWYKRALINVPWQLECCGGKYGVNDWENNVYFNCSSRILINGRYFTPAESCGVPYSCCKVTTSTAEVVDTHCGYGIRREEMVRSNQRWSVKK